MSYIHTFIAASEDCPVSHSEMPVEKGGRKTVHLIQYELLTEHPYAYDQEQLIYEVYVRQKGFALPLPEAEKECLWKELFSKGHPCLRASALVKRYGFGAHYNGEGKIALYPVESTQYRDFVNGGKAKVLKGMRSKR